MKTISDVPPEKLQQLVTDLGYDGVPRDAIRVSPQSNGKLRLDYLVPETPAQNAPGFFGSPPSGDAGFGLER